MEDALGPIWAFVVEKVAVAVLLVIAGAVATWVIERTKVDWAYKAELAKMRVAAAAETWSAATEFEARSQLLIRRAAETISQGGSKEGLLALMPIQEDSARAADRLRETAEKNRFLLGEEDYVGFVAFHAAVIDRIEGLGDGDVVAVQRAEADIERRRVSLDDFVEIPF